MLFRHMASWILSNTSRLKKIQQLTDSIVELTELTENV